MPDYEMIREVRGKGSMIGIEFGRPLFAETPGGVEHSGSSQRRSFLPTDHDPALQTSPDSGAGCWTCEPHE